jgi:flagellar hook protein FlgE
MIEGDGFFVTRGAGDQQLFTRAGSFDFDGSGKLVTPDGAILQGWLADADGTINPNNPIADLSVPYGQTTAPSASTTGVLQGNLPSDAVVGDVVQSKIQMFDNLGVAQEVVYTMTKVSENNWNLKITSPVPAPGTPVEFTPPAGVAVTFDDATGVITAPTAPLLGQTQFTPDATLYPAWPGPVTIDLSKVSQFGGANTITATDQDGFALGTLQSFTLGNDGRITGIYSNGERKALGQLALASFNNPSGLEKAGNSSFRVGDNSGVAMIGQAGIGGRGVLNAGALEMSNVDLSEEFTGLIIAQRGFQANSRVITASDELLQDLVNLKR